MPQKTNLNVAPYYDDFNESDNFVRTLFRPGFAIQARELTQLQSVLQNQLEQGFSHIFTDGTMIIPGQVTYSGGKDALRYVKLASTISGETIELDQFVDADNPVIVTGKTSGVQFMVIMLQVTFKAQEIMIKIQTGILSVVKFNNLMQQGSIDLLLMRN